MKKFLILGLCVAVASVAIASAVKKSFNVTASNKVYYIDTISGTANGTNKHGSGRTDTVYLNITDDQHTVDMRDYSSFRSYVSLGPIPPADTVGVFSSNGAGIRDTIIFVLKKKLGPIYVNVDSVLATASLKSAAYTRVSTFNGGAAAPLGDSLWASDLMLIYTIADSVHDTSGIAFHVPVTTQLHVKE